jgi:endonuclease-3
MKRPSGSSTRSTRLIAQQSSADQSVTLFKLEDPDDDEHSHTVERRPKRIKVEAGDDDAEEALRAVTSSKTRTKPPVGASPQKAKGKAKAKEIKKALDTPHPAPASWRETYDAIREMRARLPAPVDTMGCDTSKWKETDPRVRRPFPPAFIPSYPDTELA